VNATDASSVLPAVNVAILERDPDQVWRAQLRGANERTRTARGASPVQALLNLCRLVRSDSWWALDPDAVALAALSSPNVLVFRATGPRSWPTWTVSGAGGLNPLTNSDYDPINALEGFALKMASAGYLMDAEFHTPHP
jgi:hypothetical protein